MFRDVAVTGGTPQMTERFYALPDAPRLATGPDGLPELDFVWYRGAADAAGVAAAGGLLMLSVQVAPTAEERERLEGEIRAALGPAAPARVEIVSVPFSSGTAELAFAGEAGAGDFVAGAIAGAAPLAGTSRGTFVVELTRDGAALLAEALESGRDVLMVRLDLTCQHRLEDVALRVWCDARRVAELRSAAATPQELLKLAVDRSVAGVELLPERPLGTEEAAALDALGRQLLERALTGAAGGADEDLSFTLRSATAADITLSRQAVLRVGATAAQLGGRIRKVDLAASALQAMEVKVLCTLPFADEDPVETVRAVVRYAGDGPAGRIERTGEYVFRRGETGPYTFRTDLAGPDARSVACDVEAFYRGDPAPARLSLPAAPRTSIVLDLDEMGVQRMAVRLRDVPWDEVGGATVRLEHPAAGSKVFVLDRDNPAAEWVAVTRQPPAPYRAAVTWRGSDGTTVEVAPAETLARTLELDAPAQLRARGSVSVMSSGDFTGLAHLLVELTSEPGPAPPSQVDSLSFTAAGQSQPWQPRLTTPGALRYRWRQTFVYADGRQRAEDWLQTDAPVLLVGDRSRFDVTVITRLLDLTGSVRLALVDLEHVDEAGAIREQGTLTIDNAEDQRWSFHMTRPGSHTYRYRLTLIGSGGVRRELPWQESSSAILVLQPPAS